jgi:hypothetical protein
MTLLAYIDVVLVVVAAPIMLLIGVPASGYLIGAGAWIVLRAAGLGLDRYASAAGDARVELTARVVFLIARLFLLALAVIVARNTSGRDAGLAALLVIVFAYTISMFLSFINRPQQR